MNRIMKGVAAVSAGALGLTGLAGIALVTASSASAATTTNAQTYTCLTTVLDTNNDNVIAPITATNLAFTMTLTAPNSVTPGSNIPVTATYSPAQTNGPSQLNGFVGTQTASVSYTKTGGSPTAITGPAGSPNSPAVSVLPYTLLPNPAPGIINIPGAGTTNGDTVTVIPTGFTLNITSTSLGGVHGTTVCNDQGVAASVLTVNVVGAATASITAVEGQTNPAYVRPVNAAAGPPVVVPPNATVTGASWAASAGDTFTRAWCDTAGTTCAAATAAPALSVTGSTLSGTIPMPATGSGSGARAVRVTGVTSGQTALIPINVLGTRAATISPSQGGNPTTVTVTFSNFDTGSTVTAFGANQGLSINTGPGGYISVPGYSTGENGTPVTASSTGTGTAQVIVTSSTTTIVDVAQASSIPAGALAQSTPVAVFSNTAGVVSNFLFGVNSCTITAAGAGSPCSLIEFLQAQVNGGNLVMSQPGTGSSVTLSTVALTGSTVHSTGSLASADSVTVADARGTDAGWSVTGAVTDFANSTTTSGTNRTIPGNAFAWAPSCTPLTGSGTTTAITGTAATPTTLTQFVTPKVGITDTAAASATASAPLCAVAAGAGGGSFTLDAGLDLAVPPTVKIGLYKATLFLQIS